MNVETSGEMSVDGTHGEIINPKGLNEEKKQPPEIDPSEVKFQLDQKIAYRGRQKQEQIDHKLVKMESLTAELKDNKEKLGDALKTQAHYEKMSDNGLLHKEDEKKLEELKEFIRLQEEKIRDLEEQIEFIGNDPGVSKELDVKKLYEKAHEELDPKIIELFRQIIGLAGKINTTNQSIELQKQKETALYLKLKSFILDSTKKLGKDFTDNIMIFLRNDDSTGKLSDQLNIMLKSFGGFQFGEKSALKSILKHQEIIGSYDQARSEITRLEQVSKSYTAEIADLGEKFRQIISQAQGEKERILQLSRYTNYGINLPGELHRNLKNRLESYADISRNEKGKVVGRHKNWYEANKNQPGMRTVYEIYEKMYDQANVWELV